MSRTYKRFVKCGVANGNNTEYYKGRRRKSRNMNNHMLRNAIANYGIEYVDDVIAFVKLPHDDWEEPTDGTFLVGRKHKKYYEDDEDFWNRKLGKYLKSKHKKH